MAKGRKSKSKTEAETKNTLPQIPEMTFEDFKDRVVKHWQSEWKKQGPKVYAKYKDMITENPTGRIEDELMYIQYAYDYYLYVLDSYHGNLEESEYKMSTEFIISFMETGIPTSTDLSSLRLLKTVYKDFNALVETENDFNVPYLLTLKDQDDNYRIDFFHGKEDGLEIVTLCLNFGAFIFVEQAWDYVTKFNVEDVMDQRIITNQEQRALCLSLPEMAAELRNYLNKIDTYVDTRDEENPSVYTLYQSEENFLGLDTAVSYISCVCPSTGRSFMLSCENKHTNAKDAIASLLMIPERLVPHIDQISRQGEIFVVTFDIEVESQEFKDKLTSERVGLPGELYFSKLVYES